jgi:hypothetical protein
MPLSTNGLQEGDFTLLRVLKNGVLQDVLSLTASGTPDISQGSLVVGHTSGLQTQLNAKASTTALTSLATEIDTLDEGVTALGSTVVSLSAVVASKASQGDLETTNATVGVIGAAVDMLDATRVDMQAAIATKADSSALNAVSSTLTTQLNTVSSLLGTRASASGLTALTAVVAGKQDNLGATLESDELQLASESVTMASGLFRLSGGAGVFTLQRLIDDIYEPLMSFQYNADTGTSRVICPSEFRASSIEGLLELNVLNTLSAGQITAPNLYSRADVDGLFDGFISTLAAGALPADKTLGLPAALLRLEDTVEHSNMVHVMVEALTVDLETKQDVLSDVLTLGSTTLQDASNVATLSHPSAILLSIAGTPLFALDQSTGASLAEHFDCTSLSSGVTSLGNTSVIGVLDVNSTTPIVFEQGNYGSFLRLVNGHHLDTYVRSHGGGRAMNLQYYSGSYVRVGNTGGALGVNCNPGSGLQFDVVGAGRISGDVQALSFTNTSDARIKEDVLPASLEECARLVQTVRPQTYRRTDLDSGRRLGYIANHWDAALSPEHRNIMGPLTGEDSLLSLDYSRIVAVLHGALLSALARIDALESRIP